MKKLFVMMMMVAATSATAVAQDYLTRNGKVKFFSSTAIEDIEAVNNEAVSSLNTKTGDINFVVAILGFKFDIKDMQDHFNQEDYMHSSKFPKASFKGKITNLSAVEFTKNGTYNVTVEGNLTMKDVTKPVKTTGVITVNNGKVNAKADFTVNRKEFNVTGKSFVQKKIAENIKISVDVNYDKR
jgi:polyisoprenoid-binding protein YceI